MHDPESDSTGDLRADAAIADWFAAVEREGSPDPEKFIERHPECAAQLREFLADYKGFKHIAAEAIENTPHTNVIEEQRTLSMGDSTVEVDPLGIASFGTYSVLHEIARGGMGIVFKARDKDLKREVAIKVLLEQHHRESDLVQRFVEEAQIAGQLQHPGITPVYAVGEFPDQRPYFTMKLVKGTTLSQLLRRRSNPLDDRPKYLKIFEQICHTLAYAHSRGVIHRDLKPSNIMVGGFDEVQVMDWGLAKVLAERGSSQPQQTSPTNVSVIRTARSDCPDELPGSGSQTQIGSILGTLAYMPPEQAMGEIDRLDQRSDVFGLGAILCEILTGSPPYVGTDQMQLRRMAIRADLTDALDRLDRCESDEELKNLARRALSPEPENRPADAGAMAQEMTSYREGVETRLRLAEFAEVRATTRAAEERTRRKLTLMYSTVVLIVLSIGVIGTTRGLIRAQSALQAESMAREELRRELYVADLQLADQIWESPAGTARNVAELLAGQIPAKGETDLREFAWRSQWTSLNQNSLILKADGVPARIAAFASDNRLVSLDEDLTLRRWNLPTTDISNEIKLNGPANVSCWAISADARRIALGSFDQVFMFDAETGVAGRKLPGKALVQAISLSADGRRIAVAWGDGRVEFWETETEAEPTSYLLKNPNRATAVDRIEFSPDGQRLYLLDYPRSRQVTLLSADGTESLCPTGHRSSVYSIAVTADGRWTATGDANGNVHLSDNTSENAAEPLGRVHHGSVSAIGFSADGQWLATGGVDGVVAIWDVAGRKHLMTLKGHQGRIYSLCFAQDGQTVASTSEDGDTRIWSTFSKGSPQVFGSHSQPVFSMTYSSDGRRFAVGTGTESEESDGFVSVWDVSSGQLVTSFRAAAGRVLALVFSNDGKKLFTGGYDSQLRVWNSETGESISELNFAGDPARDVYQSAIGTLAISVDGTRIAAGFGHPTYHQSDYQQAVKVWDVTTGRVIKDLHGHFNTVCEVAFSQDGSLLATASDDLRIRLWSTKTWQVVQTFEGSDHFKSVTFSVDGKNVVAGDSKGVVTFWNIKDGRRTKQLHGHASAVQRLAFSPDGRALATASWDHTIKLWEPESGRVTRTLRDHEGWISCLAFAPNGNTLATGSFDATVRLWKAATLPEISACEAGNLALANHATSRQRAHLNSRRTRPTVSLPENDLVRYSGAYDNGFVIGVENDHLTIQPIDGHAGGFVKLYPQSKTQFFARDFDLDVKLIFNQQEQVTRVMIYHRGVAYEVRRK